MQASLFESLEPEDTAGPEILVDDLDADDFEPLPAERPTLRPYQVAAIEGAGDYPGVLAALQENRSTLLVMATGTGKTTVFGEVARRWPGRVLVLAHRDELIEQAAKRLELICQQRAAIEKANFHAPNDARLVVASVQTMQRGRLADWNKEHFGLVIIDECHHAPSRSYQNVLSHFAGAKILGVTATPDRSDRLALGKVFESVAFVYDIADGIKDGHLVPIRGKTIEVEELDLSDVGTVAGDLNQGQLDQKMADARVLEGVANPTFDEAGDRPTILFTTSVANAHSIAAILNGRREGCARAVDGGTETFERRAIMEGFRNGGFQFLANCGIATEGFDAPRASCVSVGRPTKSRSLFVQMVGRGLRPDPGSGKSDCLVLDFSGNAGRHNLCTPIDVLAGKYKDDEVAKARVILKKRPELTIGEALEEARKAIISEHEAKLRAERSIRYKSGNFDPFDTLQVDPDAIDDQDWQFGAKPATQKQMDAIARFGMELPRNPTFKQAKELLDKLIGRANHGFATMKQLKLLSKHGLGRRDLTMREASALIDVISRNGWRKPSGNIWQLAGIRERIETQQ